MNLPTGSTLGPYEILAPLLTTAVPRPFRLPAIDDAQLEEDARVGIRGARKPAGFGIALGEVEPALFGGPAVGPEDGPDSECPGAGQRVLLDPHRIVDAVEFDRLANWGIDDVRVPLNPGPTPPIISRRSNVHVIGVTRC